jgi:hypothetical protein
LEDNGDFLGANSLLVILKYSQRSPLHDKLIEIKILKKVYPQFPQPKTLSGKELLISK